MLIKYQKSFKSMIIIVVLLMVTLIIGLYFVYNHSGTTRQPIPRATITKLSTQSSSTNNEKKITTPTTNNQGTAIDNNGSVPQNIPPPSKWVSSSSGYVTIETPTPNSQVFNNFELVGKAKVDKVQYRLIDNQTGVISQGFINVVGGNFSANVGFKASGGSGRLDVFSVDSSGVEINEVQLQVTF